MRTELRRTREVKRVEAWRRGQLSAAGFPFPLACALARNAAYDLHMLIELVERGCPPRLAARIAAPIRDAGGT